MAESNPSEVSHQITVPAVGSADAIEVDALYEVAHNPVAQCVLAHGAGAGLTHGNMQQLSATLVEHGISTLRFNFPFMQMGQRRVDSKPRAVAAISAAFEFAQQQSSLPTLLAGHSFGGRMCSHAVLDIKLDCVGLVFCSFPLHPSKKPGRQRAAHLPDIAQPMLFLSGTRDDLADGSLLAETVSELSLAKLHWLETANHSYTVLKRTRQNPLDVFTEMGIEARRFVETLL